MLKSSPSKLNSLLSYLYYEVGRQTTPSWRLCFTWSNNNETSFTKWHYFLEIQGTPQIEKMNQRTLLNNEVVLDLDEGDYDKCIEEVKKQGYKFIAYKTEDSRARHIHLFFDELASYSRVKREKVRSWLIKKYGADDQLRSDNHLIPIETIMHWKTGKVKDVYCQV